MKAWYIIAAAVLAVLAVWIGWSAAESREKQQQYLANQLDLFSTQIQSIMGTYEQFSQYIFEQFIDTPDILAMIAEASQGNERTQAEVRDELYRRLLDTYVRMQEYDFRQLHVHTAEGLSFLRFHSPGQFGDPLFDVRDSIRIVNTEHRYVSGFEPGRIFNGYRYVYPLKYEGSHIGSAEISVSLASMMQVITRYYPQKEMFFLIPREEVESIVFDQFRDHYIPSVFSRDFLFDRHVQESFSVSPEISQLLEDPEILDMFCEYLRELSAAGKDASVPLNHMGSGYIASFLGLRDVSGSVRGYLLLIVRDDFLSRVRRDLIVQIVLGVLLAAVFLAAAFIYILDKIRLAQLSSTDSLTGLLNRRSFSSRIINEHERGNRYGSTYSVIAADLDNFKQINDTFGHHIGDEVLKSVSHLISQSLRKVDAAARWGGEEFMVLLPETVQQAALVTAERIRTRIEEFEFRKAGTVTVSMGVSERAGEDTSTEQVFQRADAALYRSKALGKNRTSVE